MLSLKPKIKTIGWWVGFSKLELQNLELAALWRWSRVASWYATGDAEGGWCRRQTSDLGQDHALLVCAAKASHRNKTATNHLNQ